VALILALKIFYVVARDICCALLNNGLLTLQLQFALCAGRTSANVRPSRDNGLWGTCARRGLPTFALDINEYSNCSAG